MNQVKKGHLVLIFGPMFAGKSEETCRLIRRLIILKKNILAFKPCVDIRDSEDKCVTHAGNIIKNVIPVKSANEILKYLDNDTDVSIIEELQFFGEEIVDNVLFMVNELGIYVIANGLISDKDANPFGYLGKLIPHAETIKPLTAVCTICGSDYAIYSQAINKEIAESESQVHVGAEDEYEPRCRDCFTFNNDFKKRMNNIRKIHQKIKKNGKLANKKLCSVK